MSPISRSIIIILLLAFGSSRTYAADLDLFQGVIQYLLNKPSRQAAATAHPKKLTKRTIRSVACQKALYYGVDPDLVLSVIEVESNFEVKAVSPKGAIGLMQLMPGTARDLEVNPWDTEENIEGGVRYLAMLIEQFDDVPTALKAYNAGPNRIVVRSGLPLEARVYLRRVTQAYQRRTGRNLCACGK